MEELIKIVLQKSLVNGGFSFNFHGFIDESEGYMVSLPNMEERVEKLTTENLTEYVQKKLGIINTISNSSIGLWKVDSEWCLDVSVHVLDRATALTMGLNGKQTAIYDIKNEEVIYI